MVWLKRQKRSKPFVLEVEQSPQKFEREDYVMEAFVELSKLMLARSDQGPFYSNSMDGIECPQHYKKAAHISINPFCTFTIWNIDKLLLSANLASVSLVELE